MRWVVPHDVERPVGPEPLANGRDLKKREADVCLSRHLAQKGGGRAVLISRITRSISQETGAREIILADSLPLCPGWRNPGPAR